MIRRLKIKFLALAMSSLLLLLVLIVIAMNLINYSSVVNEADDILSLLSQNKGAFPEGNKPNMGINGGRLPPQMSPELPYESRYFSVLADRDGHIIHTDTGRIASVDPALAADYAAKVLKQEQPRGFADRFRFCVSSEGETVRIIFLDCGRKLDLVERFFVTSCAIALCGFLAVFAVMFLCAGRILRPIAESHEKQKRFITDAGHEIKTPLTVIQANADLLAMELGQNESVDEIRRQTDRLRTLTGDLVYLSRMEESDRTLPMIDFPVSEIVSDTAQGFSAPIKTQGKTLTLHITPLLTLHGNAKSIEQLVAILMDNAIKYSPENSEIVLTLSKTGRVVSLSVTNRTKEPIDRRTLPHVFDRFWRADPSRNSASGGHGIGLSIARATVTAHGGRITAAARDDHIFEIIAAFPV